MAVGGRKKAPGDTYPNLTFWRCEHERQLLARFMVVSGAGVPDALATRLAAPIALQITRLNRELLTCYQKIRLR